MELVVRVTLVLGLLAILWAIFFHFVVVARISRDYHTFCDTLLANSEVWTIQKAEKRLETGDILLILVPVHFVDTICHAAMVIRTTSTELAVLEIRKEWMRESGPCYLTLRDFLRGYDILPYRLIIRRFRCRVQNTLRTLDTERMIQCTRRIMSERYDSVVVTQQINRWVSRLGGKGILPLLPQPRERGKSYCSRALLQILIAYGALDPKTDVERTMFGPYEWAVPAAMSRRRYPLMSHIIAGFELLPFVQVVRGDGVAPSSYLGMMRARASMDTQMRFRRKQPQREWLGTVEKYK